MPNAQTYAAERMPEVPVVSRIFSVPTSKVATVMLDRLEVEKSTAPITLVTSRDPFVWDAHHDFVFEKKTSRYFPGQYVRAFQDGNKLFVTLFPVQVDLQTGQVLKIRSAELKIAFHDKKEARFYSIVGSESIILTREKMRDAALLLQEFHERKLGIKSDIVTVESIGHSEPPVSEADLPEGYRGEDYDQRITDGYDYLLARKIIHYLQSKMGEKSPARYVTLLGPATEIPPSYYFSIRTAFGKKFGVTDFCYASRNQCTEPRLAIGRLPFSTLEGVSRYLDKVSDWMRFSDESMHELSVFGGKAFPEEPVYVGELSTLSLLGERADWRGVKKYFRTKGNYNKQRVLEVLGGKSDSPFVYYLDHGRGNQLAVEKEYISSAEILALPKPVERNFPLVVSVSCSNAAYDSALLKESVLGRVRHGTDALGVALLKSKAGAVAYVGSARPSLGAPIYHFDQQGNLNLTGTSYFLRLLDAFFEKYRVSPDRRLGDVLLEAMRAYLYESGYDPKEDNHKWTFLGLVLLGDPTLRMPWRRNREDNFGLPVSLTTFDGLNGTGLPLLFSTDALKLRFESKGRVRGTLYRIVRDIFSNPKEEIIAEHEASEIVVSPIDQESPAQYFWRLENERGVPVERQVWFEPSTRR